MLVLLALSGDGERCGGARRVVQREDELTKTCFELACRVDRCVARDRRYPATANAGVDIRVTGVAASDVDALGAQSGFAVAELWCAGRRWFARLSRT